MNGIFISYRRRDSESFSGRLRDRLRAEFGQRSVFMDTSAILGGARFDEEIVKNLKTCKVVIAVIGQDWLTIKNEAGTRRLDDPEDWVRKEMAQALASDAVVIPVLFGGATMPATANLPPNLQALTTRNAVAIADADFDSDVAKLIEACLPFVRRPRRWPWLAGAAALMLALGGWYYANSIKLEFRGVYVVPSRPFYGKLPLMKNSKTQYFLALSVGSKRVGVQDLTRKAVFIVSDSGIDAPASPKDIADFNTEISQHFKSMGAEDFEAIAARLSLEPIVISSLSVRPGAKVSADIGVMELDADGKPVHRRKGHCEFTIPDAPAVSAPVFYVSAASAECKSAD